jgi:hypothetical protein
MFMTISCSSTELRAFLERELKVKNIVLDSDQQIVEAVRVAVDSDESISRVIREVISAKRLNEIIELRFESDANYFGSSFAKAIARLQERMSSLG